MKALVFEGYQSVSYQDVPDPGLVQSGDAIVQIERTAICGSDLHFYHNQGYQGPAFTIGHECLGQVVDIGAGVERFSKGDRVLVSCTVGCGHCAICSDGLYSGCETHASIGPATNVFGSPLLPGGQAEAIRVPSADINLFHIPDAVEDEQILFLSDILPTGYMGAELADVRPGDTVVVIGCGPVGVFAQQAAKIRGAATVIAVDLDGGRLKKAAARGCRPLNPLQEDLNEVARDLTHGRGADCAIEAVGREQTVLDALGVVRRGGRVAVIGVVTSDVTLNFMSQIMARGITLRSAIVSPQVYFPKLLPLIEQGRLDPTEIITHRLSLSDGPRGYEIFDRHEEDVLKVVMTP
ncbi:MAG: alcohol dehydrogenase [OM182 bacterium MED-G24]|uniref:Alcohol dehydrogenase n=1 Tax=OM182 bacterium MED-G24 TaxID=1986255 RepID=A0A2A5WWK1_9GAMM|nr:MAG: alcohol dehydrogenase [OM182 bacterium MED-G24]